MLLVKLAQLLNIYLGTFHENRTYRPTFREIPTVDGCTLLIILQVLNQPTNELA